MRSWSTGFSPANTSASGMAAYWLDLVRYADTVGYHGDQDHHAVAVPRLRH